MPFSLCISVSLISLLMNERCGNNVFALSYELTFTMLGKGVTSPGMELST